MSYENRVQHLNKRLKALDAHRAKIKAELDRIGKDHIEAERVEAPGEADAALFSLMTKARLMQILEEHWSMHHMHAVVLYENVSKAEMVNMVLAAKGLEGHLEEPVRKERKAASGVAGPRKSAWRS